MINFLKDLNQDYDRKYGTKAWNLGKLIGRGINVPMGIAISENFFSNMLEANNISLSLNSIISQNDKIHEKIFKASLTDEKINEVFKYLSFLNNANGNSVAVRSSFSCEDTSQKKYGWNF